MIKIENNVIKTTNTFWNHCLFHPTDAIEDPWGKRIIDRFAKDKSIGTIRIYAMLEDIVYTDEDGKLLYDFRINDLRLDYLIENGLKKQHPLQRQNVQYVSPKRLCFMGRGLLSVHKALN